MSVREPWFSALLRRRGGCAFTFIDPLGWKAHGGAWPYVWLARKFRIGSRPNQWAYQQADRVVNRRIARVVSKAENSQERP